MSMSLKVLVLVLAAGSFGLSSRAMAADGENRDAAIGIIGGVISGAIEAEQANQEAADRERQCIRLQRKCEKGSDWACGKYEEDCND